jgi:HEPN domain-containing protein
MYRSPKTASNGASGFLMLLFILWGALYVAGCADASTGMGVDMPDPQDPVEVELAVNGELSSLLIDDVSNMIGNDLTGAPAVFIQNATELFASARSADSRGEVEQAVRNAFEARTALARALQAGGDGPLRGYIERTRQLRDRLASGDADDEFDRPADMLSKLSNAVAAMESDMGRGDEVGAARRAVRANHEADRDRSRRGDRGRERDGEPGPLAEFWVGMAAESVDIAERFLEGTEPSERQIHALEAATRMAESAETAFGEDQLRRAMAFSHRAVSLSLMAVIMPEVTAEDAAAIEAFAAAELEAAWTRDLTELEAKLLERAQTIFDEGVAKVRAGELRGVNLIWRAGVVAAVIAS